MQNSEMLKELVKDAMKVIKMSYEESGVKLITEEISVEETWISMSDGIQLRAVIYKPRNIERHPLILQRTCYPQNEAYARLHGEMLAKRGYAFMFEYCRGTGGSQGNWEPNVNDRQDGLDTLYWLEEQDWVECIGYWGDSYLAFTGWVMADAVTPKVKSMCLGNYGTDRYTSAYEKRLFRHDVLTSWAMGNAGFEITADYIESCRYRPHERVDEALWGKKLDWYKQWVTSTKREDAYWQQGFWKKLKDIPSKVKIPVYISEGWFDHHLGSALKTWESLSEEAKEHSWLDIGPLNHFGLNSITSYQPVNLRRSKCPPFLDWFEQTLKQGRLPRKTVNLYVIGVDQWKEVSDWPCPDTVKRTLYLSNGEMGKISEDIGENGSFTYEYDPENPVPSKGAEAMLCTINELGSQIQPEQGYREDVITFESNAFEQDMKLFGKVKIFLHVSTDVEDTAFTAKLMEVTPEGKAYNIRSSITTIAADTREYTPNTIAEVQVNMWDIVWTIKKGSRLRLDISSSDFPQYAVHSNYPGVWARHGQTKKAKQTVYYGEGVPSRIEVEILPQ